MIKLNTLTTDAPIRILTLERNPSVMALIELLVLDEEQLLNTVKAHIVVQFMPALIPDSLTTKPDVYMANGFSLLAFLREQTVKPAGKQLASLLRTALNDRGDDICKRLDYCNNRDQWKSCVISVQKKIAGAFGFYELRDELGQLKSGILDNILPDDVQFLESFLGFVESVGASITANIDWATDIAVPVVTPISISLFVILYALDELCQCDRGEANNVDQLIWQRSKSQS